MRSMLVSSESEGGRRYEASVSETIGSPAVVSSVTCTAANLTWFFFECVRKEWTNRVMKGSADKVVLIPGYLRFADVCAIDETTTHSQDTEGVG